MGGGLIHLISTVCVLCCPEINWLPLHGSACFSLSDYNTISTKSKDIWEWQFLFFTQILGDESSVIKSQFISSLNVATFKNTHLWNEQQSCANETASPVVSFWLCWVFVSPGAQLWAWGPLWWSVGVCDKAAQYYLQSGSQAPHNGTVSETSCKAVPEWPTLVLVDLWQVVIEEQDAPQQCATNVRRRGQYGSTLSKAFVS